MGKKQKIQIGLVCLLFLAMAWIMERQNPAGVEEGGLERKETGQGDLEMELELNAEGILEDCSYSVTITEYQPTEEEAKAYFREAREEIDSSFYEKGEDSSGVTEKVCIAESYVRGIVEAEWSFDQLEVIDLEGSVNKEAVPEQGVVVWASAELSCGAYGEMYSFPFQVVQGELSEAETLLASVEKNIAAQQQAEGEKYIYLPREAEGVSLSWKTKKENLVWKLLFIEGVALLLVPVVSRERKRSERKKRERQLLLDYPDMVSQLTILVGAGMSIRQSWNRISARYLDKRRKNTVSKRWGYEEMAKTARQMEDGKGERQAYEDFGENTGLRPYHRFVRILVENLQKGNRGLATLLEQETEAAFDEHFLLAKKMGEEASTRMLLPLILMMAVVMAVVIAPAIIGFM